MANQQGFLPVIEAHDESEEGARDAIEELRDRDAEHRVNLNRVIGHVYDLEQIVLGQRQAVLNRDEVRQAVHEELAAHRNRVILGQPPQWLPLLLGGIWEAGVDYTVFRIPLGVTLSSLQEIRDAEDGVRKYWMEIVVERCLATAKNYVKLMIFCSSTSFVACVFHPITTQASGFRNDSPVARTAFTLSFIAGLSSVIAGVFHLSRGKVGTRVLLRGLTQRQEYGGTDSLYLVALTIILTSAWVTVLVGAFAALWGGNNSFSMSLTLSIFFPLIILMTFMKYLRCLPDTLMVPHV